MKPAALLLVALGIGAMFGICLASNLRASPSLRFVTVKSGDWVRVKGQHLECNVAADSVYCIELGGWPRLSFMATTTGGAGMGEFYIHRTPSFGAQGETLAEVARRR